MTDQDIREILLTLWDPLGVGNNPFLKNEYDSFVREISKVMKSGTNEKDLTDILIRYDMELGANCSDFETNNAVAKELMRRL